MLLRVEVQQVLALFMGKQMQASSGAPVYECHGMESKACTVPRAAGESGWTSNCSTRSLSICNLSFFFIVHLAAQRLDFGRHSSGPGRADLAVQYNLIGHIS
jgi:hypothetical protein